MVTRATTCFALAMVVLATGCQHRSSSPTDTVYPPTGWQSPYAVQRPDAVHVPVSAAPSPTPLVRGQNGGYGGTAVQPLPNDPHVGPRYASSPQGYTVQPVQYIQPGGRIGSLFAPPGAPPGRGELATPGWAQGPIPPMPPPALPQGPQQFGWPAQAAPGAWPGPPPPPGVQPPFLPPDEPVDLDILLEETQTGRFMFGAGVNSDAGLIGNIVIDEQNFDIARWPTSWRDFGNGTAFRGAGQRFRLEALPGTEVQRYSASFSEPYLFGTSVSMGLSGFYYERAFFDWDEQRVGGRMSLGYIFPERRDLSTTVSFRYEQIDIFNPRTPTPPELAEVVGDNDLIVVRWEVANDTRDNTFLPTQGYLIQLAFEQGLGTFSYPRFEGDYRRYFVTRQRPDGSGRHVLGLSGKLGVSGSNTPIYEHFFAGGFSTIRGFDFRGASPRKGNVIVGGEFQFLASAEYRFPLTADDNLFGSFFLDAGTVEENVNVNWSDVRITPGFELRINIPALGPVPLALGLGVPIQHATGDEIRNFHFFVGLSR